MIKKISILAIGVLTILIGLMSIPYSSAIELPDELPITARYRSTENKDYRILDDRQVKILLNFIEGHTYKEYKGVSSNIEGNIITIIIDFNYDRIVNVNNENYSLPITLTVVEDNLKYSYLRFNDTKKGKLMDFKLSPEQITGIYEFVKKELG